MKLPLPYIATTLVAIFFLLSCAPTRMSREEEILQKYSKFRQHKKLHHYEKALASLKVLAGKYPAETAPEIYGLMAQTSREWYQWSQAKGQRSPRPYLVAIRQGQDYFRCFTAPERKNDADVALGLLGTIARDTFASIPYPYYDRAVRELARLLPPPKDRGAKYLRGIYHLHLFHLDRAEKYLKESKMDRKSLSLIESLQGLTLRSEQGKKLVFRRKLTRGEGAALFFHEVPNRFLDRNHSVDAMKKTPVDTARHWARLEIDYALMKGVIHFDKGRNFNPHRPFTRLDGARMVTRILVLAAANATSRGKKEAIPSFADEECFSRPGEILYAQSACHSGYMKTDSRGKFRPHQAISGLELLRILSTLRRDLARR